MIEIQMIDGNSCPILFCDVCGERVEDASKAAVVFESLRPDGERPKALHVHKGSIDGKACHHQAELIIQAGGGTPGWQEWKLYICNLAHNVAFPASEMAVYDK